MSGHTRLMSQYPLPTTHYPEAPPFPDHIPEAPTPPKELPLNDL